MAAKERNILKWSYLEFQHMEEHLARISDFEKSVATVGLTEKQSKDLLQFKEMVFKLDKILDRVQSPKMRLIMKLRHWDGLTWDEIGQRFGMSEVAIRKYYEYCLLKLSI